MTHCGLQRMAYSIMDMVLSDCAEQLMLLPAQWSIYSKQEVMLNLTFVLGGLRCSTHKAKCQFWARWSHAGIHGPSESAPRVLAWAGTCTAGSACCNLPRTLLCSAKCCPPRPTPPHTLALSTQHARSVMWYGLRVCVIFSLPGMPIPYSPTLLIVQVIPLLNTHTHFSSHRAGVTHSQFSTVWHIHGTSVGWLWKSNLCLSPGDG